MFFILSKTLNYLSTPIVWISLVLVAAAFWPNKAKRKIFVWIGLFMILFFSNDFISNQVMRAWEIKPVTLEEMKYKQYRVGIVLTGVTAIEPELDDRVFFARGADRVAHAVQLYKLGVIQKILISGGTGKLLNPEEGEAMKLLQAFIYMGVPEWAILIESESRNTHESALASKEIIEGTFKPEDCLLITSAFHMRRARACFHKIGWPIDTYSVDVYSSRTNYNFDTLFIPKIDALIRWHKLSKECTGMLAYKIAGYI